MENQKTNEELIAQCDEIAKDIANYLFWENDGNPDFRTMLFSTRDISAIIQRKAFNIGNNEQEEVDDDYPIFLN